MPSDALRDAEARLFKARVALDELMQVPIGVQADRVGIVTELKEARTALRAAGGDPDHAGSPMPPVRLPAAQLPAMPPVAVAVEGPMATGGPPPRKFKFPLVEP